MTISRWTPLTKYPLTSTINKCFPQSAKKRGVHKADIVSDKLCDDILQRVSPFLRNKPPVDIIDLWPGAGLWSSKVNDFLNPRRHVLVEPNLASFESILKPLAKSKPCYDLQSMEIDKFDDWENFISKHLPEQGTSSRDSSGSLAKNHSLLVLANPPPNKSKRDHYTPARWWSILMETCMRQSGINSYGSVRLLVTMPTAEALAVMPRSVIDRKRVSLLTESIAGHVFEVAGTDSYGMWSSWKGLGLINDNAARVAERAAEQNVVVPAGRELPPLPLAPESPEGSSKIHCPHAPRLRTNMHDKVSDIIHSSQGEKLDAVTSKRRQRALSQLNLDNRKAYTREQMAIKQRELNGQVKALSRAAADPNIDNEALKSVGDKAEAMKAALLEEISALHFEIQRDLSNQSDDVRASIQSGSFDSAILQWDRRPFEPLFIEPEELFPRETTETMIYFEANANSSVIQRINALSPSEQGDLFRLFDALSLSFSSRSTMSTAELLKLIFPDRTINDIVRSVPSLSIFAWKSLKSDFANWPRTVQGSATEQETGQLDPAACFQENLDYDLSGVPLRILNVTTLWDILFEYHKQPMKISSMQLIRLLGGSLTAFRSGEYGDVSRKRLH